MLCCLDMFLEMREAGLIQKARLGAQALPAREIVHMATAGGAKTLRRQNEMGVLAEGKRANIIFWDPGSFHAMPSDDPATNVVYAHAAADVMLTMVNGEILYEEGDLTTIDEEQLRRTVLEERRAVERRASF